MSEDTKEIKVLTNHEQSQLSVWLAEYDACHQNRNHLDTIRWIIGTIFIVASFTLLGFSFQDNIAKNAGYVFFLTFISICLMLIWVSYSRMIVQRYIDKTYERLWKLENNIRTLKLDIQLHTNIKNEVTEGKGRKLDTIAIIGFFVFCVFRIVLLLV